MNSNAHFERIETFRTGKINAYGIVDTTKPYFEISVSKNDDGSFAKRKKLSLTRMAFSLDENIIQEEMSIYDPRTFNEIYERIEKAIMENEFYHNAQEFLEEGLNCYAEESELRDLYVVLKLLKKGGAF